MNAVLSIQKAVLICATVLLALTFTSWQERAPRTNATTQDTVPPKREKKVRDLDEALAELDNAQEEAARALNEVDWEKVQADMKEAMKNMDVELKKASADMQKSLREIDVEKLRQDVQESVAKIDWDGLKKQIEQVKTVDMEAVKNQLSEVKVQMEKLKPELEKSMQDARESMGKAKEELQAYKRFEADLERDGLINKKEGYKIEYKSGQLIINGKQQPAEVYNKYRAFLEKRKPFTLEKDDDGMKINND